VAQITHVQVRETVPDSILDRADDVELVDLTPEDLLQRLKEARSTSRHRRTRPAKLFRARQLTALRELALRRTAQRVDAQMVNYMRAHAIQGPWEAGERVLVCIDDRPGNAALVRYGRRLADRLRASWAALYIETPRSGTLTEAERDRVAEALRIAERLGGEAVTVPAASVADGIVDYAHANNFTPHRRFDLAPRALVRNAAELGGARDHPPRRRHQRPRRARTCDDGGASIGHRRDG
jgi:two-component system sensor histidine kinase KdpD